MADPATPAPPGPTAPDPSAPDPSAPNPSATAPGPDAITAAAQRLAGRVRRTPIVEVGAGSFGLGDLDLVCKLELLQHTGSFKARGAFNFALSREVPPAGIIAASGGNHGQAVAYVARALGHRCEVYVPGVSSPVKRERIASFGADVRVVGEVYDDAQAAANERAAETGALQIHPYEPPEVMAGQGTCARELDEQRPGLDTVLVAVGGGGFIAGTAAWFGDRVRVVAVEPATSNCLHAARAAGEPVRVEVKGVAADSLGARQIGAGPWQVVSRHVDESVLVDDDAIVAAQRALWADLRIAAEPGGATALAALISGAYCPEPGERLAVMVCGGNVDPATLA
ncbi:MAG: threonine/serine dehydratase [Actinomycetota bacterium]|nr:threonine/serine dehydratase [Actinomycetota bacterium]